jgi:hypothetical protein
LWCRIRRNAVTGKVCGVTSADILDWVLAFSSFAVVTHGCVIGHPQASNPLLGVAAILGNSARIIEKHYAQWIQSRQDALEKAVKATWA